MNAGPSQAPPIRRLPAQLTPFVGRDRELAEIARLLGDPNCRLLTLVGQGGAGKTRLAVQAAGQAAGRFQDGGCFVDLQALPSGSLLANAISDALGVPLAGQEAPIRQLARHLRNLEILLVLDNFEHLLEAAGLLSELLREAPRTKLLVTSRESLNLQEEWLYLIGGLPYPEAEDRNDLESYPAVELFVLCARRMKPGFSLQDEADGVRRICRLVEGMPLALELAATWIKTLDSRGIAAEIERNLEFLTTSLRNVPERHRSLQAVFEQSWQLMSSREQAVFQRLSVFRGGFEREAAEQVAGATLPVLSGLVDKSLLRQDNSRRYRIHELLRQYAEDRLQADAQAAAETHNRHGAYYAEQAHRRTQAQHSGQQVQSARWIIAELENIRAAWYWALSNRRYDAVRKIGLAFNVFLDFQSRYQEGAALFQDALEALQTGAERAGGEWGLTLAEMLVYQGWLSIRLGKISEARRLFEESLATYQRQDLTPQTGYATDPLAGLGLVDVILGDYRQGIRRAREAAQNAAARGDVWNGMIALYVITSAEIAQGRYEEAGEYARQALQLTEQVDERWFRGYVLIELGKIACGLDDYEAARGYFQESYEIKETFNEPGGLAVALEHLGLVALKQGEAGQAEHFYRRSLGFYREIGDHGGVSGALNGLGMALLARGEFESAKACFQQALQIASEIGFRPRLLEILCGIARLFLQSGKNRRGLELLAIATRHPASEHATRRSALARLEAFRGERTAQVESAWQAAADADLDALAPALSGELAALQPPQAEPARRAGRRGPAAQPLIEPLTERELEVLALIADGHTNQEIADRLFLSLGTVKWYTGQIYSKLGVGNRTQAAAQARELGLLS